MLMIDYTNYINKYLMVFHLVIHAMIYPSTCIKLDLAF